MHADTSLGRKAVLEEKKSPVREVRLAFLLLLPQLYFFFTVIKTYYNTTLN